MGKAATGGIYARYRVTFYVVDDNGDVTDGRTLVATVALTEDYSTFDDIRNILGIKYGRRVGGNSANSIKVALARLLDEGEE